MTRPIAASRPAYVVSWRSNARQTAPTDLAAQSVTRAGSARMTPIRLSVALVEVAALEEVEVPVVVLDAVVELEEVLHDLGRGVALRARVVRERDELGVALLKVAVVGVLRGEADEPRVEREPALAVPRPEFGRPRLSRDLDRQVHEVVG